jgi:hypothetical protein
LCISQQILPAATISQDLSSSSSSDLMSDMNHLLSGITVPDFLIDFEFYVINQNQNTIILLILFFI